MKIQLNNYHIRRGRKTNCEWCPIALAIRDHLVPTWETYRRLTIRVGIKTACINFEEYELPEEVSQFIRDFDSGKEVQEISFELNYGD